MSKINTEIKRQYRHVCSVYNTVRQIPTTTTATGHIRRLKITD